MNYKRQADPEAAAWFEPWNRYAVTLQGGGVTAVATGMYLNDPEGTVAQAAAVAANPALVGWVGYSYRTPSDAVAAGWSDPQRVRDELAASLTAPDTPFSAPVVFNRPPPVTALLGRVEVDETQGVQTVELLHAGEVVATTVTDANGRYGFVVGERRRLSVAAGGRGGGSCPGSARLCSPSPDPDPDVGGGRVGRAGCSGGQGRPIA